jgi:hypothetical protein
MAMKMNAAEKANDSTIRAFNAQIEKAYKTLGANNTVTQNLINKARSVYGASNMKEMSKAGNNIPQISRTRATVSNNTSAKALHQATHYTSGARKGQFKSMYDVTKAHQKAMTQILQDTLKATPNKYVKRYMRRKNRLAGLVGTTINGVRAEKTPMYKALEKAVKSFEKNQKRNLTASNLESKISENDLASEIFDAYAKAKENNEDTGLYEDFARDYHGGNEINYDLIQQIQDQRAQTLREKSVQPDLSNGLSSSELDNFFDGFVDIYNPYN